MVKGCPKNVTLTFMPITPRSLRIESFSVYSYLSSKPYYLSILKLDDWLSKYGLFLYHAFPRRPTAATISELAQQYDLKSGKWIFYVDWSNNSADNLWGKVVVALRNEKIFSPQCGVAGAKIYAWTDSRTNPHRLVCNLFCTDNLTHSNCNFCI